MRKIDVLMFFMFISMIFMFYWGMFADVEVMLVFAVPTVVILSLFGLIMDLASKEK